MAEPHSTAWTDRRTQDPRGSPGVPGRAGALTGQQQLEAREEETKKQGNSLEKQQLQVLPSTGRAKSSWKHWIGHISWWQQVSPPLQPAGQAALPSLMVWALSSSHPLHLPLGDSTLEGHRTVPGQAFPSLPRATAGSTTATQQHKTSVLHIFLQKESSQTILSMKSPSDHTSDHRHCWGCSAWPSDHSLTKLKLGTPEIQELWCCSGNSAQHSPPQECSEQLLQLPVCWEIYIFSFHIIHSENQNTKVL